MKLIKFDYLKKSDKQRGLIIRNGEVVKVVVNKHPRTELTIKCEDNRLNVVLDDDNKNFFAVIKEEQVQID